MAGRLAAAEAQVRSAAVTEGRGKAAPGRFSIESDGACRLELSVAAHRLEPGPRASVFSVKIEPYKAGSGPFSFFLRDVNGEQAIYLPA